MPGGGGTCFCGSSLRRTHSHTGPDMIDSNEAKLFSKAFRLARNQCCNYADSGPFKKRNYCFTNSKENGHQCSLIQNSRCEWFEAAVLPTNPDLKTEWKRFFEPEQITTKEGPWVKSARCECGTLFRSKSNRQTLCDDCSKKQRRIKQRGYRNKNRVAGADKRAFRAGISQ